MRDPSWDHQGLVWDDLGGGKKELINRSLRTYDVGEQRERSSLGTCSGRPFISLSGILRRVHDGWTRQPTICTGFDRTRSRAPEEKSKHATRLMPEGTWSVLELMQSDSIGTSLLSVCRPLFVRVSKCPTPPRPSDHPITQSLVLQ